MWVGSEMVDHITNMNLKSLRTKEFEQNNCSSIKFNSIRNKFERKHWYAYDIGKKSDQSFPAAQFLTDGYSVPFAFDRDGMLVGFFLSKREDIFKILSINKNIVGFSQRNKFA